MCWACCLLALKAAWVTLMMVRFQTQQQQYLQVITVASGQPNTAFQSWSCSMSKGFCCRLWDWRPVQISSWSQGCSCCWNSWRSGCSKPCYCSTNAFTESLGGQLQASPSVAAFYNKLYQLLVAQLLGCFRCLECMSTHQVHKNKLFVVCVY